MARKAKKSKKKQEMDRSLQVKLSEIASRLGTSVDLLVEQHGDPETVVKKWESGELQLLNE